jgi:excisionase family DNA binding protein
MSGERLLKVEEVAAILGLKNKGTVYHMVSEGRLPCVRLSARCLRFQESAIERYIESLAKEAASKSFGQQGQIAHR